MVAAKVPDPFQELLKKRIQFEKQAKVLSDEAAARDEFEKAAIADALAKNQASMHGPQTDK